MHITHILALALILSACEGERPKAPTAIEREFIGFTRVEKTVNEPTPMSTTPLVPIRALEPSPPPLSREEEHLIDGETVLERARELAQLLSEPIEGMLFVGKAGPEKTATAWTMVSSVTYVESNNEMRNLTTMCIYATGKGETCDMPDALIAKLIRDLSLFKSISYYAPPELVRGETIDLDETAAEERVQSLFVALRSVERIGTIIEVGKTALLVGETRKDAKQGKLVRCIYTLGSAEKEHCTSSIDLAIDYGKRESIKVHLN